MSAVNEPLAIPLPSRAHRDKLREDKEEQKEEKRREKARAQQPVLGDTDPMLKALGLVDTLSDSGIEEKKEKEKTQKEKQGRKEGREGNGGRAAALQDFGNLRVCPLTKRTVFALVCPAY